MLLGFLKIVKNFGYVLVMSGDDGLFECNVIGNLQLVIIWLKELKFFDLLDLRISIFKLGILKIISVQVFDVGWYVCVVINSLGMVYLCVVIFVYRGLC